MRTQRLLLVPLCQVFLFVGACGQDDDASPPPRDASLTDPQDMASTRLDMMASFGDMATQGSDLSSPGKTDQGTDQGNPADSADLADPADMSPSTDMSGGMADSGNAWAAKEGYYPVPKETFEVPVKSAKDGLYIDDIQAQFPKVSWKTLDRLYIPAGHYKYIYLGNLPKRDDTRPPLVITNKGGQVKVGGLGHYYLFVLKGGSNWVLSGRYDSRSKTGDAAYPGHRNGAFARSQGTYGFLVDDEFQQKGLSGISVAGKATAFAIEFAEIRHVDFAGMTLKTDDDAGAVMQGVELRDLYIHDTGSEGIYAGSTQTQPQHTIKDWKVYNNRLLRTGTEALQLGQVSGQTEVHHNVIGPAAIDWRAAFQIYQDGTIQVNQRQGLVSLHHNIILGGGNSVFSILPSKVSGDTTQGNQGLLVEQNYISGTRFLGAYIGPNTPTAMTHTFRDNTWRNWQLTRHEVYPKSTMDPGHLIRISGQNMTPVVLKGNTWEGPASFVNLLKDKEGNGTSGAITGSGNRRAQPPAVTFIDAGFPPKFDELNLEMWTDRATLYERDKGAPAPLVTYPKGKFVTHLGQLYRCLKNPCQGGKEPPKNKDIWALQPLPADDVRVTPGSDYDGYGPQPPR